MSIQTQKLTRLRACVKTLRERELSCENPLRRRWLWLRRWMTMLHHEYVRDDVPVRAQSLAFLMLLSLMPLIAGGFFLFTVFAQFGMVQEAIQGAVERFLTTIPLDHRAFVQDYILKFKDAYLGSLQEKSGSIGIFALFILIYVGIQSFINIDSMLNQVWCSDKGRPFLEHVRNFIFASVVAPIVLIAGLSLPLILQRASPSRFVFEHLAFLPALINYLVTPAMVGFTFLVLYRYVPVRRVRWKAAALGALAAALALELSNYFIELYFRYGTNTAYGKAAVIPLIAFWMYVVWIIVIMGAEVSFVVQNERELLEAEEWEPSFREGEAMIEILGELDEAHRVGSNPVEFERLRMRSGLTAVRLRAVVDYLVRSKLVLPCASPDFEADGTYALAKDLAQVPLPELLRDFYAEAWGEGKGSARGPIGTRWRESLEHWSTYFKGMTVPHLRRA